MVSEAFIGRKIQSLLINPIILLHFFIFCSIWIFKSSLESRATPKCSCWGHLMIVLLLKGIGGCIDVFDLREKTTLHCVKYGNFPQNFHTRKSDQITSFYAVLFACFLGSGLNCSFHWQAQLPINSKSEFKAFWELRVSITFEKSDVSSAKILRMEVISLGKSFIYISRTKMDLLLTPVIHQNLFFSNQKFEHLR